MSIKIKDLKENEFYYKVGIAAQPKMDVVVSTWVYIGKHPRLKDTFAFCEWNEYMTAVFRAKQANDKPDFPLVGSALPELNPKDGELELVEFVSKAELLVAIQDVLYDDDVEDKE